MLRLKKSKNTKHTNILAWHCLTAHHTYKKGKMSLFLLCAALKMIPHRDDPKISIACIAPPCRI